MWRTCVALVIPLVVPWSVADAQETSARESAEQLLVLTHAESTVAVERAVELNQARQLATSLLQGLDVRPKLREMAQQHSQSILALMSEELSYSRVHDSYREAYTSVYTAEELATLVTFYQSPIGRAIGAKSPIFQVRLANLTRARVEALQPRLQAMRDEFMAEVKRVVESE